MVNLGAPMPEAFQGVHPSAAQPQGVHPSAAPLSPNSVGIGLHLVLFNPNAAEIGRECVDSGPELAEFGRSCASFGRDRPQLGPTPHEFGRDRPNLVHAGPNLAEVPPQHRSESAQQWSVWAESAEVAQISNPPPPPSCIGMALANLPPNTFLAGAGSRQFSLQ